MYAGFWLRAIAAFVDMIIILAIYLVGWIMLTLTEMLFGIQLEILLGEARTFALVRIVLFLFIWLYFAGYESSKHQATPGKMGMEMKVCDVQGKRITFLRASIRYFSHYLSALCFGLGYLITGFTKKKQALHDFIVQTVVVNEKSASEIIGAKIERHN